MSASLHLSDLECFVLVYELRNFSRAADALCTAQSQVSARVQRLERLFGTRLFVRLPHGIAANAKGDLLYRQAKELLRRCAELEDALRGPDPRPVALAGAAVGDLGLG
jgi:DNA-binding transcriptional LysR family regulator